MNHSVVYVPESEAFPLGKAWKSYWRDREKGQSPKAKRYIRKEKAAARKRIHRRLRYAARQHIRNQHYNQ